MEVRGATVFSLPLLLLRQSRQFTRSFQSNASLCLQVFLPLMLNVFGFSCKHRQEFDITEPLTLCTVSTVWLCHLLDWQAGSLLSGYFWIVGGFILFWNSFVCCYVSVYAVTCVMCQVAWVPRFYAQHRVCMEAPLWSPVTILLSFPYTFGDCASSFAQNCPGWSPLSIRSIIWVTACHLFLVLRSWYS